MISIIIPTYNNSNLIQQTLSMVLAQTFKNVEIIVVDDGSTDDAKDKIEEFILHNRQASIRYFYQENSGPSKARNKGIHEARGEYMAFLDADDLWVPEYLEKSLEKISQGFEWVVCDNYREEYDAGNQLMRRDLHQRDINEKWDQDEILLAFLASDRVGSPSRIFVKSKALLDNQIHFNEKLRTREDWDFCLQLAKNKLRLGYIKEPLVIYRIWSDASNSTRRLGVKWIDYTCVFLAENRECYIQNNCRRLLADHYYYLAREALVNSHSKIVFLKCLFFCFTHGGIVNVFATIKNKFNRRIAK